MWIVFGWCTSPWNHFLRCAPLSIHIEFTIEFQYLFAHQNSQSAVTKFVRLTARRITIASAYILMAHNSKILHKFIHANAYKFGFSIVIVGSEWIEIDDPYRSSSNHHSVNLYSHLVEGTYRTVKVQVYYCFQQSHISARFLCSNSSYRRSLPRSYKYV